jgi:hypothetical protein
MGRIKIEAKPQRRRLLEWCSFCGAPRNRVDVLVPNNDKSAFICNVCVETAVQVVKETLIAEAVRRTLPEPGDPRNEPMPANANHRIKPAEHVEAKPSARPERLTSVEDVLADLKAKPFASKEASP